jgi:hypothetical protein
MLPIVCSGHQVRARAELFPRSRPIVGLLRAAREPPLDRRITRGIPLHVRAVRDRRRLRHVVTEVLGHSAVTRVSEPAVALRCA